MFRFITFFGLLTTCLAAAAADPTKEEKLEREKLIGHWFVIRYEKNGGVKFSDKDDRSYKFTITEDKIIVKTSNQVRFSYVLDVKSSPKRIDLTCLEEGKSKGTILYGIYSLDGDTLKICDNYKGEKSRPDDFVTKRLDGRTLMVLKREKK